jgi:hypothetical protein
MMEAFLFRCPMTKQNVQGWLADAPPRDGETYLPVQCAACRRVHHVNPATGRVLGVLAVPDEP